MYTHNKFVFVRTLAVGMKELTEEELTSFRDNLFTAQQALDNREQQIMVKGKRAGRQKNKNRRKGGKGKKRKERNQKGEIWSKVKGGNFTIDH